MQLQYDNNIMRFSCNRVETFITFLFFTFALIFYLSNLYFSFFVFISFLLFLYTYSIFEISLSLFNLSYYFFHFLIPTFVLLNFFIVLCTSYSSMHSSTSSQSCALKGMYKFSFILNYKFFLFESIPLR